MTTLPPRGRLGFAVMVGPDGDLPEALLHDLKAAGYTGIEPNCYQPRHLPAIIERCRNVDLAIHALPTGRWLKPDQAREDYEAYTQRALDVLRAGATMAAALDAPLIFGLIRGTPAIGAAESEAFLTTVIRSLVQTTLDLKILVEPIADDEAAWPHTLVQGAALLERLNLPNVKLLADSYHVVRSGQDWHGDQHRAMIGHLHIRDHGRQIPGDSRPEYAAVYAAILRVWQEENLVLSFEPNIELRDTLENALAGVAWLDRAASR
ncbi:MAG: TIM barrel protein [Chloroflexi bacterium]|nr:TIM barrel protein [Chloroflexota bacterium]